MYDRTFHGGTGDTIAGYEKYYLRSLIDGVSRDVPYPNEDVLQGMARLDEHAVGRFPSFQTQDIVNIVGVFAGIKPVAQINPGFSDIPPRYQHKMESLLEGLSLRYKKVRMENGGDYLFTSRSDELIDIAAAAWNGMIVNQGDRADYDRIIGAVLGYPESAVEYFVHRDGDLTVPISDKTGTTFNYLAMSPGNDEQEHAEYGRLLETAVATLTPRLYKRIRLAAELETHQDILSPVAEARKRLGELAMGNLLDRFRNRKKRKELETVIHNHEQAVKSGYEALDPRDIPAALADKAQAAYNANLEESRQHLAQHSEDYSIPEAPSVGEKS